MYHAEPVKATAETPDPHAPCECSLWQGMKKLGEFQTEADGLAALDRAQPDGGGEVRLVRGTYPTATPGKVIRAKQMIRKRVIR